MIEAARSVGLAVDFENREKDDFYPTPREVLEALLEVEDFHGPIWEPACGDGAISRILEERGHTVISSDLVDRGYGESRIDFLMEWQSRAPNIITNPPFKYANDFMRNAIALTTGKVALLLRLGCLEGIERGKILPLVASSAGVGVLGAYYPASRRYSNLRRGRDDRNGLVRMGAWLCRKAHTRMDLIPNWTATCPTTPPWPRCGDAGLRASRCRLSGRLSDRTISASRLRLPRLDDDRGGRLWSRGYRRRHLRLSERFAQNGMQEVPRRHLKQRL